MTCNDCIHRELCADYVSSLAKVQNADVKYISQWLDEIEGKKNQTDNECEHFADRSQFVELPSDGVMYGVLNGKPIELSNYISPPKGKELFILSPKTVNVPFFKSKEEAEQALKERETDGKK